MRESVGNGREYSFDGLTSSLSSEGYLKEQEYHDDYRPVSETNETEAKLIYLGLIPGVDRCTLMPNQLLSTNYPRQNFEKNTQIQFEIWECL